MNEEMDQTGGVGSKATFTEQADKAPGQGGEVLRGLPCELLSVGFF